MARVPGKSNRMLDGIAPIVSRLVERLEQGVPKVRPVGRNSATPVRAHNLLTLFMKLSRY